MSEMLWWSSLEGPTRGYQPWAVGENLHLSAGSAVWVRVAAVNGADETVDGSMNFVVPATVEVARYDQETRAYMPPREGAENPAVGVGPANEVKFFFADRRWLAGQTWMRIYLVVIPASVRGTVPMLYEVGDADSMRYCEVQS
jgi:hypothetical protein